jgi:hypothetical protein
MPVAVIQNAAERFELKSLEGAYVVIKRMTYGQKLTRSQMAMKMRMQLQGKGRGGKDDTNIDIDMMNRLTSIWSFQNLIEDHNLEDADGRKLNFRNVADIEKLQGDIGEEIDSLIDKLNNFDEKDEEVVNLSSGSGQE